MKGDENGALTEAIIRELVSSGVTNVSKNAPYRLDVKLIQSDGSKIGYRYNKQKVFGKIKNNIVGAEKRLSIKAEVTLFEKEDQIKAGPFIIEESADLDFVDGDSIQDLTFINSDGREETVLAFSLGQLEPIDSATNAAERPLYKNLAKKIAETIFSVW